MVANVFIALMMVVVADLGNTIEPGSVPTWLGWLLRGAIVAAICFSPLLKSGEKGTPLETTEG